MGPSPKGECSCAGENTPQNQNTKKFGRIGASSTSPAVTSPRLISPMTSLAAHDDEWELCNEDGFVYKRRRKRPRQAAAPPPPPAGPSEEDMREWRLQRRRRALLKLREESRSEIRQWEGFAGELQQMNLSQRQSPSPASPLLRIADFPMSGAVDEVVIDRLLSQVSPTFAV